MQTNLGREDFSLIIMLASSLIDAVISLHLTLPRAALQRMEMLLFLCRLAASQESILVACVTELSAYMMKDQTLSPALLTVLPFWKVVLTSCPLK